jgi:hypothetical protein
MSNNQAISWCHLNIKRAAAAVVESITTETLKYLISKWSYSFECDREPLKKNIHLQNML